MDEVGVTGVCTGWRESDNSSLVIHVNEKLMGSSVGESETLRRIFA